MIFTNWKVSINVLINPMAITAGQFISFKREAADAGGLIPVGIRSTV
jgi:hypothetical protein